MTTGNWKELIAKRASEVKPIPAEWRVSSALLEGLSERSLASALDIPRQSGVLTPKEVEITEKYDAVALLEKLLSKEFSAYEVALAYCKRAAIAHQVVNCLTETFFDEGLERAKYLDKVLAETGKPVGPLHGLPISIKDTFNVKGLYATVGYVSFIEKGPADYNSPLVDVLLDAGATLYCKTNVPQTLYVGDSNNNIFGRTLNPQKLCLTAGGSSGGEGALVAMRGSVIGVGTDIAGSIRIPAMCCGAYGFKPSSYRVAYGLQNDSIREGDIALEIIPAVAGPITNSLRDARLFMEAVVQDKYFEFDFTSRAVPWISEPLGGPLTIGLIMEAPGLPVSPPISRAVATAAQKLKAAGHRIIPLSNYPSYADATKWGMRSLDFDEEQSTFKWVTDSGEPFIKAVDDMFDTKNMKPFSRRFQDMFEDCLKRDEYKKAWHDIYRDNNLDIILAPANNRPAPPHDTYSYMPYTFMWNIVQRPAFVLPYLKVDKKIDGPDARVPNYDPEVLDGVSCHIQIVGRPFKDERLMAAVEEVDRVVRA